ncbi:hypothetical protein [Polaribacter sp. L3A8]|uniref:hypothetical protein n=1 Tax=Polaribacter sp. L3A8 TaxID=2686361 RepID=UPI00131BED7F|nr:hypothetical protein [Polaribacter sp. L3A8]
MKNISFNEPINISKNHFKNLEDFLSYIAQNSGEIELNDAHKEILDKRILEVNENPENYISLKNLKSSIVMRKVSLEPETLALLKFQAEKKGDKLINYMETILKEKAIEFELSDEYKLMMDDLLKKHDRKELNYISEEEFFKRVKR